MDEATLDAALSRVALLGEWSSENILVSVYESLDSENMIEIDLCKTLRGPHRHQMSRVNRIKKQMEVSHFRYVCTSDILNFRTSELQRSPYECMEFAILNF